MTERSNQNEMTSVEMGFKRRDKRLKGIRMNDAEFRAPTIEVGNMTELGFDIWSLDR
jgi:hypothetical protein